MKQALNISALIFSIIALNLITAKAYAMLGRGDAPVANSYSQGYQDGFIYTAQQTGKGCKDRLSPAAVERLDMSVKNNSQIRGDSTGDGMGDGDGDGDNSRNIQSDYNLGKMQGMGDVLGAPGDSKDLCTNGD
jgi:hypothetical protein